VTPANKEQKDRGTYAAAQKALASLISWIGLVEQDDVTVAMRAVMSDAWKICGARAAKPSKVKRPRRRPSNDHAPA
jgi:hypothetical protein